MPEKNNVELAHLLQNVEADKAGITSLEEWEGTPTWERAQKLLLGARSVIVFAMEVLSEVMVHLTPETRVGEMALGDLYRANVDLIGGRLNWFAYRTVKALHSLGFKGLPLWARPDQGTMDWRFLQGALSYKHAAQAAGFGTIGWHSLLITPEYGPRVRLACVLTNAHSAAPAAQNMESPCSECGGVCIRACPAKAIGEPQEGETYHINKYACCAYYRASVRCGLCLKVCPSGRTS
jgi:epoxyqueuosine reductase QueG